MTKTIEIEVIQQYTRTIKSTMEVPISDNCLGVANYISKLELADELDGEFECTELVKSGKPTFYYKDTKSNSAGYVQLKTKE